MLKKFPSNLHRQFYPTLKKMLLLHVCLGFDAYLFVPFYLQCFFCPSEASFHQLIRKIREKINSQGNAMFEIYEKPIEEGIAKLDNMDNFNTSDDEFEIL